MQSRGRRANRRLLLIAGMVCLAWFLTTGMGYRVEGLVACDPPEGEHVVVKDFNQTCPFYRIMGCDDTIGISLTDVSEYEQCRIQLWSQRDPVRALLYTGKNPAMPASLAHETAKAGRHSPQVCSDWFSVKENGGSFQVNMRGFGPAGWYIFRTILECQK
jgi:hypothetical protein